MISHKSEALECFRRYLIEVENQLDKSVKALRTDRGREYLSDQFRELCEEKGIVRQLIIPRIPQQNGVAKRKNQILLDMVRSMMEQVNLPISYWGDALLTATYILNRVPSKSIQSTPYELWTGRKPELGNMRPWGSAAYVHNASHEHGKLGPRGKKCIFVRYFEHSKGYVFIGEQLDGTISKIESRDAEFLEMDFPSRGDVSKDKDFYEMEEENGAPNQIDETKETTPLAPIESGSDIITSTLPSNEESPVLQLRRSQRGNIPRRLFEIEGNTFMADTQDHDEPRSYREAMSSVSSEK